MLLRRVIGAVLRRIRLRQGRTLQDVARAADVSLPYLSEVERGRKEVSSEVLAAICRALGIGLADLLDEAQRDLARLDPRHAQPRASARLHTDRAPQASGRRGFRSAQLLCGGRAGVALSAILPREESFVVTLGGTAR